MASTAVPRLYPHPSREAGLREAKAQDKWTVAQAFAELLSALQIEHNKKIASDQQQRVREKLEARLKVLATYLTGSYRRNTQIFPLDDIDLLVVLDRDEYKDMLSNPATGVIDLLDLLEQAIRDAYATSEIERHDRCIRIKFAGTGIGFDVIPAFQDSADVFLIPDKALGQFVATNPKEHQRLISEKNQGPCEGMLVPLVKLLKAANNEHGALLSGFHVEVMAYYALLEAPYTYRAGVATLLRDLSSRVWFDTPDPWPLGRRVDEHLKWTDRSSAAQWLGEAASNAEAALKAEEDGDTDEAHRLWRLVFGDWYPVKDAKAADVKALPPRAAVQAASSASHLSATSAGLIGVTPGYMSVRRSTSHGGTAPHRLRSWSGTAPDVEWHEREIAKVLQQFTGLKRITPAEAAADPKIWPVKAGDEESLYAVLVGDQRTNLGIRHRLLILIPKDAPTVEPAFYDLRPHQPARITKHGWRPKQRLMHHWAGRVLCTHAARDRWDGQLITLVIWAVDWLFRQDYHQRTGRWIGDQIDGRGRLVVNGRVQRRDSKLRLAGGRIGRRVPQ